MHTSQKYPGGKLSIFFGSQTGTAEGFARTLMEEGKEAGFDAKTVDLEEFDPDTLADSNLAIFLMATYGEGEPTDNAAKFARWLKNADGDVPGSFLSGLKFTVFGLGNRQYEHFNKMGKQTNAGLESLGAQRVYTYGEGDDDGTLEEDFDNWKANLWTGLCTALNLTDGANQAHAVEMSHKSNAPAKVTLEFIAKSIGTSNAKADESRGATSTRESTKTSQKYNSSTKHFFTAPRAKIVAMRELRNQNFDRIPKQEIGSTLHVEIDLKSVGIQYQTADNLAILPENDTSVVERIARQLNYDLDEVVDLEAAPGNKEFKLLYPTPCSIRDILTLYVDIQGAVRHSTMKNLAAYVAEGNQQKWLSDLLATENRSKFKQVVEDGRRSIFDLLTNELSSCRIPLSDFLNIVPCIQPRYYTISSSSSQFPNIVHITVSITEYETKSKKNFVGLCSGFLKCLKAGNDSMRVFVRASSFRLPQSISTPIIMVGPGTGIAPMRALLQEKSFQAGKNGKSAIGQSMLFFGCKYHDMDFIYESEFMDLKERGVLTKLHTAFSRDTNKKVYVQHLLTETEVAKELMEWIFSNNAYVYVCGATSMGTDVMNAFVKIVEDYKKVSHDEALKIVKGLQEKGRYVQELWTA